MRLVTLNVRNPSFDDGPNAWPHRRDAFFAVLRRLSPDVLCLQETTESHAQDVMQELGYRFLYGTPREEGEDAEMCAILRRENTPVADTGTEWLCETPDEPGTKRWGADCPRVVTWVDFGLWTLFNVHLDHVSLEARTNGMAQVIRKADALGKPAVIVGDLNAPPDEPTLALARAAGFVDLAEGTGPTFHGFGQGPEARIDYILARGPWHCERAWVETPPNAGENGELLFTRDRTEPASKFKPVLKKPYSDHHAVAAELELERPW